MVLFCRLGSAVLHSVTHGGLIHRSVMSRFLVVPLESSLHTLVRLPKPTRDPFRHQDLQFLLPVCRLGDYRCSGAPVVPIVMHARTHRRKTAAVFPRGESI